MEPRPDDPILTVSALNREARRLLETALPALWVEGEISNFVHHGSGHMYFDLKDDQAQVRCAMFRSANRGLQFRPESGLQALVHGRVTVYEPRGSYQLVVEHMEPAGEGLLRRQLEALKARLAAEGLFAAERKRALPTLPQRVGVVTSPTGAALRDILKVLRRRFPAVPVLLYPAQVQGERAQHEIAAALALAGERRECDVLIVGRGGGSLEDLWAFNEERVVRAIHACPIPVIAAVGHETDVTLADLVADLRAPTPSAAAELAVPDRTEWLGRLAGLGRRLGGAADRRLQRTRLELAQLGARLNRCEPGYILRQHAQRLDELTLRLARATRTTVARDGLRIGHATARLRRAAPLEQVRALRQGLGTQHRQLAAAMRARLAELQGQLAVCAAGLQAVSPLATLQRGYALVQDTETGVLIRDARQLTTGQVITARLGRGQVEAEVRKVVEEP